MKPILVTRDEARVAMWCDACGVKVPKKPWPDGWSGSGRSSWVLLQDGKKQASILAHWCPKHQSKAATRSNPSEHYLRELRNNMLAERETETTTQG